MAFNKLKILAVAALVAGSGVFLNASTAGAVTISVYSDTDSTTERAAVTCTGCSVLLYTADSTDIGGVLGPNNVVEGTIPGDHGFGTGFGELFVNSFGSNPSDEAQWINSILGTSYTLTNSDKTDPASDGTQYSSLAAYVIVKIGRTPNYSILRNDTVGAFTFSWDGKSGGGAGISHFTEAGVAAVPVPAAGFLLIGALGGLVGLRRRRKTA